MLYAVVYMTVALGFLLLAVDYGRVQLAKSELQAATTSAARAALVDMAAGKTVAANAAISYGGLNTVDGRTMVLTSADVTVGTWNPTTKVFTANTASPNAVSVRGTRWAARGTAIPVTFGAALGISAIDVTCTAIASNANDVQVDISSAFNNQGMTVDGISFPNNRGIGNNGYAISDTAVNGTVTRGGTAYALSRASYNCITAAGQTLTLPTGDYKSVVLIVAHAYGAATSTLQLNYADGTNTSYSQTYSDWCNPTNSIVNQNICGSYTYRNLSNGQKNTQNTYLMSYELPITSKSGVVSITLPTQSNMNIFAVGLTPSASITVR